MRRLSELFDIYNVTMLFTSHIHAYYEGYWGKTPYIITGGAGAELGRSDPGHYFYHYIKVHVSRSGVNYEVKKLKSPDFELIDRLLHDAWIYSYAFIAIHFLDLIIILGLFYFGFCIILYRAPAQVQFPSWERKVTQHVFRCLGVLFSKMSNRFEVCSQFP